MSRWRRRLALVAALLCLMLVALLLFLRSGYAARLVAGELGDVLEARVTIDSLRTAVHGDTVALGVKLFNDGDDEPYLEADRVVVDVSVANVVGGKRLPDRIDLSGVRMTLRFNREGKMLTKPPTLPQKGGLPKLRLHDLAITLDQEGRPPLTLRRASLTLDPTQQDNLTGILDDPDLGRFAITGRFGGGRVHLRLTHPSLPMTPARFRSLPFIPRALGRRLELEGGVPLDLSLWFGPVKPRARYRVAFGPALARLLQDDRPPFVACGAAGVLEGDAEQFTFNGHIRDPRWGEWSLAANMAEDVIDLRLGVADVAIDPARLAELPFIPKAVWSHVQGTGRTTASAHVRIPLGKDGLHYRIAASPRLSELRLARLGLDIADVAGGVVIEDNLVTIRGMTARVAGGSLDMSADLDFRPEPSRLHFDAKMVGVRLAKLPQSWGLPADTDGRLSGSPKVTLITHDAGVEVRGDGAARLDSVRVAGFAVPGAFDLRLRDDGARTHLDAHFGPTPIDLAAIARRSETRLSGVATVAAQATVPLGSASEPNAWHGVARVGSPAVEVAGFAARDVSLNFLLSAGHLHLAHGRAEAAGGVVNASLDIDLASQTGRGSLTGRGLDFGPWLRLDHITGAVSLNRERAELRDIQARAHGGGITGWVRLPWADRAARAELFVAGLDAGRLSRALSRTVRVEGAVSGQASGAYHPAEGASVQLDLASDRLAVMGVPARELRGKLDYTRGRAAYQLTGETLAGKLSLEGEYPPTPGGLGGQLKLERLRLSNLWNVLGMADRFGGLGGAASLSLPYRHDTGLVPTGRGRFELRGLRYNDNELAELLSGDVSLGPDGLTLRDGGGVVAGGSLRLSGGWRFDDPSRRWFNLRVLGAEASKLTTWNSDFKDLISGPLDVTLRGDLGQEWRGSGAVALSRGKVAGVEVSDWRVPVEFCYAPSTNQAEVAIRESTAQVGNGRARLRAALRYAGGLRVEGELHLFDAALRSLLGDASAFARGRVTGRADFSANDLRSLADLTANVHAKLNDAQALQLPVLRLLVPHILPGQGALEFQAGELNGRLGGGVFRVSELTLDSSLVLLLLQGSVTLQGRLDLDVMAQTSSLGVDPILLRPLLKRVPAIGPVPIGLVMRVTELLSDRVIHLRVGGTLKSPAVRVEPIRLLSDQAARFFLSRAIPTTKQ